MPRLEDLIAENVVGPAPSVTDGTTTVNPATSLRVASLSAGAPGDVVVNTIVVSATDPGAIGVDNLWLEVLYGDVNGDGGDGRLWVRNSTDTGWNSVGPLTYSSAGMTIIQSTDGNASLDLENTGHDSALYGSGSLKLGVDFQDKLVLSSDGVHLGDAGPLLLTGTVDPSAGAGVVAPLGSMYIKTDGSVFWKTAAPNTGWTALPLNALAQPALVIAATAGILDLRASGGDLVIGTDHALQITGTLQTADPHAAGEWWSNAGIVTVSAG